jgi:iron complex transport system substrate-binding protein
MNGKLLKVLTILLAVMFIASFASMSTGCKPIETGETPEPATEAEYSETEEKEVSEVAEETSEEEAENSDIDVSDNDHYPVTFTNYDETGKEIEVTFTEAPEKVVCATQCTIETMLALGLEDKIVYAFGGDGDLIEEEYADAFADLNHYKGWSPNLEEIVALEPDFLLGWASAFGEKYLGIVDSWINRGANTYLWTNSMGWVMEMDRTIENEMQDILNIGIIFDKVDEAQAILDEMQAEIDKVKEYVETSGAESRTIAILDEEDGMYQVWSATDITGDMIEQLGGTLVIGTESDEHVGAEDIIAADPEVIIMVWSGDYDPVEEVFAEMNENEAFANLIAVQNDDVYTGNFNYFYCSGIHTVDGIRVIASALYPNLYE